MSCLSLCVFVYVLHFVVYVLGKVPALRNEQALFKPTGHRYSENVFRNVVTTLTPIFLLYAYSQLRV
jgi:hypothetical protein